MRGFDVVERVLGRRWILFGLGAGPTARAEVEIKGAMGPAAIAAAEGVEIGRQILQRGGPREGREPELEGLPGDEGADFVDLVLAVEAVVLGDDRGGVARVPLEGGGRGEAALDAGPVAGAGIEPGELEEGRAAVGRIEERARPAGVEGDEPFREKMAGAVEFVGPEERPELAVAERVVHGRRTSLPPREHVRARELPRAERRFSLVHGDIIPESPAWLFSPRTRAKISGNDSYTSARAFHR